MNGFSKITVAVASLLVGCAPALANSLSCNYDFGRLAFTINTETGDYSALFGGQSSGTTEVKTTN